VTAGWTPIRLGDVVHIKHGFAFSGMGENADKSLPIVVAIGNFDYAGGFRFDSTAVKRFRGDYPREFELLPGDVLLAMTCQTADGEILGVPGTIPDDGRLYLHNQRLGKVEILEPDRVHLPYIFQLARWSVFNRHLFVTASGSKILHTSPGRIEDFEFELPPLAEQEAIALTLGALDAKVESNRRAIAVLDDLAAQLFKRDFLLSGGATRPLADFCSFSKGKTPKKDGGGLSLPYLTIDALTGGDVSQVSATGMVVADDGDVLMVMDGAASGTVFYGRQGVVGSTFARVEVSDTGLRDVIYQALKYYGTEIRRHNTGSAIPHTDKAAVLGLEISIPADVALVTSRLKAIRQRVAAFASEVARLEQTRAALLPDLISGRLRVPAEVPA